MHARQDDHEGQQAPRRRVHQQPQHGADQAALLGHADAQHGHQHRAQRREAGEVVTVLFEDPVQPVARDQVDRLDHRAVLGVDRLRPSWLISQESRMMIRAKDANSVAGCGRALPSRSTVLRKRETKLCLLFSYYSHSSRGDSFLYLKKIHPRGMVPSAESAVCRQQGDMIHRIPEFVRAKVSAGWGTSGVRTRQTPIFLFRVGAGQIGPYFEGPSGNRIGQPDSIPERPVISLTHCAKNRSDVPMTPENSG